MVVSRKESKLQAAQSASDQPRDLTGLMFGVDARDPITLAGTASILAVVGLFAAWLPARKASRVDPTITLKG